ncbi:Dexamethasone-induced Ras- protein 1 [Branchiostoma belcheri]|nr:Dexamethasone-induced Ras- protein 1 [Branchiostoma belcheri]
MSSHLVDECAAPPKNCFRLVVLGTARVGKTAIVSRFLFNQYDDQYTPTIEDFHRKMYRIRGEVYRLDILDTSGVHPFPAMRRLSFLTVLVSGPVPGTGGYYSPLAVNQTKTILCYMEIYKVTMRSESSNITKLYIDTTKGQGPKETAVSEQPTCNTHDESSAPLNASTRLLTNERRDEPENRPAPGSRRLMAPRCLMSRVIISLITAYPPPSRIRLEDGQFLANVTGNIAILNLIRSGELRKNARVSVILIASVSGAESSFAQSSAVGAENPRCKGVCVSHHETAGECTWENGASVDTTRHDSVRACGKHCATHHDRQRITNFAGHARLAIRVMLRRISSRNRRQTHHDFAGHARLAIRVMRRRITIDVRDASRPATHHEYAGHARLANRAMLHRSSIGVRDHDCCHEIAGKRTSRVHCVGTRRQRVQIPIQRRPSVR